MKVLTGVAALASIVLVAAGGGSHHMSAPLRQRIAVVARRTARSLEDINVKTARVYGPTSYRAAMHAWDGTTTPNRRKGPFYLIVLRGRFICAWCPLPRGAHPPYGSFATRLWSPNGGGGGFGVQKKLRASISRLGRPTLISLRSTPRR